MTLYLEQVWTNCAPDAHRARKTSATRPISLALTFCLIKKKKTLDLQVFSRIGEKMKKLQ